MTTRTSLWTKRRGGHGLGLGVGFLALLMLHVLWAGDMTLPVILADEFGYLGNAAFLAGYDWSALMAGSPYYSYGYSLLLVPLFWLFDSPLRIYQTALINNAVVVSSIVIPAYCLSRHVAPKLRSSTRLLAVLAVSCYPSYLVYSNLAWAESLYTAIFWWMVLAFLKIGRWSDRRAIPIGTGCFLGYIVMVHPRGLVVVAVAVVVVLVAWLRCLIRRGTVWSFGAGLTGSLVIHVFVQQYFRNQLWGGQIVGNTLSSVGIQLRSLLDSGDSLLRAGQVGIGQAFYLGAASYGLAFLGAGVVGTSLWSMFSRGRGDSPGRDASPSPAGRLESGLLFIGLSAAASFVLSVVYLARGVRLDHFIYGRYSEAVVGPLVLIGILSLICGLKTRANMVMCSFGLLVLVAGVGCLLGLQQALAESASPVVVTSTAFFPYRTTDWRVYIPGWLGNVLLVGVFVSLVLTRWARCGLILLIGIFLWVGHSVIGGHLAHLASLRGQSVRVAEWISDHHLGTRVPFVVGRRGDGCSHQRYIFQFVMPETRIVPVVDVDELIGSKDAVLLSCGRDLQAEMTGIQLVAREPRRRFAVWMSPEAWSEGSTSLPSDKERQWLGRELRGDLPVGAYSALIEPVYVGHELRIERSRYRWVYRLSWPRVLRWTRGLYAVKIRVVNLSSYDWPSRVKVGVEWFARASRRGKVGESRVKFGRPLRAGEEDVVRVPLKPVGSSGELLMPGRYTVRVSLVAEGIRWFHEVGVEPTTLSVRVE